MNSKNVNKTLPGRLAAKAMGRFGGRPIKLNGEKIKIAIDLYTQTNIPIVAICRILEISRPTFYAFLKEKNLTLKNKIKSKLP